MKMKVNTLLFFIVCVVMCVTEGRPLLSEYFNYYNKHTLLPFNITGYAYKNYKSFFETVKEDNSMDVSDFSVYYNIETNEVLIYL